MANSAFAGADSFLRLNWNTDHLDHPELKRVLTAAFSVSVCILPLAFMGAYLYDTTAGHLA